MSDDVTGNQPLSKKGLPLWAWALIVVFGLGAVWTALDVGEDGSTPTRELVAAEVEEAPEPKEVAVPDSSEAFSNETTGEKNARGSAESYLSFSAFSRTGLIDQLLYEGFSQEEADYAVDILGIDWSEQAAKSAESYLRFSPFSRSGLVNQLVYEAFSATEAEYGVQTVGADWNEQAARSAESYLEFSSFSRSGLIDQLLYEGFSESEAEYGVSQNGY